MLKHIDYEEALRIEAENRLDQLINIANKQIIKDKIDQALDQNDKDEFYKWSEELNKL